MCTNYLKFIYSEKATKFCEILTLLLTVCTVVKSKVKISQNSVAFSEYMNFTKTFSLWVGLCFSPTSTVNKIIRSFPKLVLILWIFNLKFFSISCFFINSTVRMTLLQTLVLCVTSGSQFLYWPASEWYYVMQPFPLSPSAWRQKQHFRSFLDRIKVHENAIKGIWREKNY